MQFLDEIARGIYGPSASSSDGSLPTAAAVTTLPAPRGRMGDEGGLGRLLDRVAHRQETQNQIERLEQAFDHLGAEPEGSLAHCRVFVVEDEYFIAEEINRTLRARGAEIVGPAPTITAAMSLLSSERIDAAVLDVSLQGEVVFPLADVLRERRVPFVFATGYDKSIMPGRYSDVPHWKKPFSFEDLANALSGLIQKS